VLALAHVILACAKRYKRSIVLFYEMHIVNSVLELIGNTPLVRLSKVAERLDAEVLVKLEYMNPTGSIKDRVALNMIEEAEKRGDLKPGDTIVEASTGNTGTALSFIGMMKGYTVVIYETTPGHMGDEKRKLMNNYGAYVEALSPEFLDGVEGGVAGAEVERPGRAICLEREKNEPNIWWARQFSNPDAVKAQNQTAEEILEQSGGSVDAYVASIGTGGTLMGIAEVLKERLEHVKVIGVYPSSSKKPIVPGQPYPRTDFEGGIISDMMDAPGLIDEVYKVGDEELSRWLTGSGGRRGSSAEFPRGPTSSSRSGWLRNWGRGRRWSPSSRTTAIGT
jgi:cysteine synthase A